MRWRFDMGADAADCPRGRGQLPEVCTRLLRGGGGCRQILAAPTTAGVGPAGVICGLVGSLKAGRTDRQWHGMFDGCDICQGMP